MKCEICKKGKKECKKNAWVRASERGGWVLNTEDQSIELFIVRRETEKNG